MEPPTPQTLARHGLTEADWHLLWESQCGLCGICNKAPARGGGRFVIDHDHKTGLVRGLVHPLCNGKLGKVRDDMAWLAGALEYLNNPPARRAGIVAHSSAHVGNRKRRRRVPSK